jgi:hypothetical protein
MHHDVGHRLYFSRDVIRVNMSRRMRRLDHVVCMGNMQTCVV